MRRFLLCILAVLIFSPAIFAIVDTNGNGLSDLWERQFSNDGELFSESFDPHADPDADGWTNAEEVAAGTNPFEANPPNGIIRPDIERIPAVMGEDEIGPYVITPAAVTVTWPTLAGKQYTLLFSPDLTAGSWLPVGDPYIGNGNDFLYGFPTGSDDKRFWRVAVSDIDTDADGLTDTEEHVIGSSPYLADTDGDGIDDAVAYAAGLPPAGADLDGDGVPDGALYTVEFEVQTESRSLPSEIGYKVLTGIDAKHRYLTSTQTEDYSVAGSASYADVTNGIHNWTSSYLKNGIIQSGTPVAVESGTSFSAWQLANGLTLGPNEILETEPTVITVSDPVTTATETYTTTTYSTPWEVGKKVPGEPDTVIRNGTETITIVSRRTLSASITYQSLWADYLQNLPWETPSWEPSVFGPLNGVVYNRYVAGDASAAESVRDYYRNHDFAFSGTLSNPGSVYIDFGSDTRLKSLRWRWVRFDPLHPFDPVPSTPPAATHHHFHVLLKQRDSLRDRDGSPPVTYTDTTSSKGILQIECEGGLAGWQTVPLVEFAPWKLDLPFCHEDLDFSNRGYSHVTFGSSPSGFIVGAGDERHVAASIMEHSAPPSVVLDTISTEDVNISGGEATITIAGDVYDSIMGAVPAGDGADIENVTVLLNGAETEFESPLTRSGDYKTFWTPEGPKASIQPFSVTIPASGVNRITVETAPNAAGLKGRAEFDVVFEKVSDVAVTHAAQTIAYDLLLPPTFSVGSKETIKLVSPGQSTGDDLVETENDSRLFRSALSGAVLLIGKDFQPSAVQDGLSCAIAIPGIPTNNEALGSEIVCQETGPATLRFAYSRDIVSKSESSVHHWNLASVDMANPGSIGMAQPVSFLTSNPGEDAGLDWLDTTFSITRPDGDYRNYASTAEGKPLIGFLIRSEDEEGVPLREFIYYDHSAGSMQRKEVAASSSVTTYKLKSNETVLGEFELPIVGWRLLDLDGVEAEGLLPVSIESLIDLVEGDTSIEIPEESQAIIEVTGRAPCEVLRVFSPEETADRFDLIFPGEAPLTPPSSRNATLTAAGQTPEKLVIYSSGGEDGPVTLTDSQ